MKRDTTAVKKVRRCTRRKPTTVPPTTTTIQPNIGIVID